MAAFNPWYNYIPMPSVSMWSVHVPVAPAPREKAKMAVRKEVQVWLTLREVRALLDNAEVVKKDYFLDDDDRSVVDKLFEAQMELEDDG